MRALPDWSSTMQYLVSLSPQHDFMGDDGIRLPIQWPTRIMEFFVRHLVHASGMPWLYFGSRLGVERGVDMRALAMLPPPGPVGALCLARDVVCVGHNIPILGLRTDHIDRVLQALGGATLHYLAAIGQRAPADVSALSHLSD